MERYIQQLIEDLEQVAKNPPSPSYIETPPHLDENPEIAELALAPFKTIEELTGIKQEAFPEMDLLQGDQWERVNQAIFNVFESLNIMLIDVPPYIPPEWLYEVLSTNWQHHVQYLPLSGMDLELCTGDPMTCPYGEFCDCGNDWENDEMEIPERFNALVPQIAKAIEAGFHCYLDPKSLEMEKMPDPLPVDYPEFDPFSGIAETAYGQNKWDDRYHFAPLEPFEWVDIMEGFSDNLENTALQKKLRRALGSKHPIGHFNALIHPSDEKQNWLEHKQAWLEQRVRTLIWENINGFDFPPQNINGFFNDDGTPIDPAEVPVPSICIICRKYYLDDPEENILCLLNRNDQRDQPDFRCGAFEKM